MYCPELYYKDIIETIISEYENEFKSVKAGHCMKIIGLPENELIKLFNKVKSANYSLEIFILSKNQSNDTKFITSNKLIELRNDETKSILILQPSNLHTSAEDSFANATFKEISLENIDDLLFENLKKEIKKDYKNVIDEIIRIIGKSIPKINYIQFLLTLKNEGFNNENIGNNLFLLGLIPDKILCNDVSKLPLRLTYNIKSIDILTSFNLSIKERIEKLELKIDTIQQDIFNFLKENNTIKEKILIGLEIKNTYQNLNFSNWVLPQMEEQVNREEIKLFVEFIKSDSIKLIDGRKSITTDRNKSVKIKVRFKTDPVPKTTNTKVFKILLMGVDGASGEEIREIRKLKNTDVNKNYRDCIIELQPNTIDEGSYFLKVLAEDENGITLNTKDDFKDSVVQREWLREKEQNPDKPNKDLFQGKLTCDSDDFDYLFLESDEELEEVEQGVTSLSNVMQAFFNYRIEKLLDKETLDIPTPEKDTSKWIVSNNKNREVESIFHIQYSSKNNFHITISTKLKNIETEILNNSGKLGYCLVKINSSISDKAEISYKDSILSQISSPDKFLKSRSELFHKIKESSSSSDNQEKSGIFETFDFFNNIELVKNYLSSFIDWTSFLVTKLKEINEKENILSENEKSQRDELQKIYLALQNLDLVKIETKMPNQKNLKANIISPLHPLRLAWFLELYNLFSEWENKTIKNPKYSDTWKNDLKNLFFGKLNPSNNPLVMAGMSFGETFEYAGELMFGWGIYLKTLSTEEKYELLTSPNRQLISYIRQILNINSSKTVEIEFDSSQVESYILNYLKQHPYTDKLVINIINAGDAKIFADSFVKIEKKYSDISYEVRIFNNKENIIEDGISFKKLLNPGFNITEEAEAFSQPSLNNLIPKLRFSVNNISEFFLNPTKYDSNISFVINPFPQNIKLFKATVNSNSFYLNGLIINPLIEVEKKYSGDGILEKISWTRHIPNYNQKNLQTNIINILFNNYQIFIASSLAGKFSESLPCTQLSISEKDNVLLNNIHDNSDWVITFDKILGPEIYDLPSKEDKIPFLLDYTPDDNYLGVSSFLTTRLTSEIIAILKPHFSEYDIDIKNQTDFEKINQILNDLRAISSSLILKLNSTENHAFEVIGTAFTKKVLEKKNILKNSFIIPIDLHQNLFKNFTNKKRADILLVFIDSDKRIIKFKVIEIKCRSNINNPYELKDLMLEQIENTISVLKQHFDPNFDINQDRIDRKLKNKELKSLLKFYLERSFRFSLIEENYYKNFLEFLDSLDNGYKLEFEKLGIIFDFGTQIRHKKELISDDSIFFTIGSKLIKEILSPDTDLDTNRLESIQEDNDLINSFNFDQKLSENFIKTFQSQENYVKEILPEKIITNDEIIEVYEEIKEVNNITETNESILPEFDIYIGDSLPSKQYGILGKTTQGKKIALDLNSTNTISLFGVQGGGKSYTIGTVTEMVLKNISNINSLSNPLAGVIFHYSESMDYEPEFTSMCFPNDSDKEISKLKELYNANPDKISDIVILTPKDKVEERKAQYPDLTILSISFNSKELSVTDWLFLLGAVGNDSTYVKQIKAIMKELRNELTIDGISEAIENSLLLDNRQKQLAKQRISFARDYINDSFYLKEILKPGRLILVDLRDEFIDKDEALGLFVIMLNIFSSVKQINNKSFNKFIVFDEAHKYMGNKDLTNNIVSSIREMRHKGVSIMIASQDPPSLPNEIIELSSLIVLHKFNSPQWLKHIQKSIDQLSYLNPADLSSLSPGEAYLWSTKSDEKQITLKPVKISTRPRVTKHGGATIRAMD